MSEAELQRRVVEMARWLGWKSMHIHDSRKSSGVGFPDLVLVHNSGRLMFVELKSEKGRPTDEQMEWLAYLGKQHEAHLWRPADWDSGQIQKALTDVVGVAA